MRLRRLVLFVEGDDDLRFLERVIKPLLTERYELVRIQRTSQLVPKEICKILLTLKASGWDYLFISDKDEHPCKTKKRQNVVGKWTAVQIDKVVIVDSEIESWYVAGADSMVALEIGFTLPRKTESFTKENLSRCTNKRYPTATDIKLKLLENYSVLTAKERSASFAYLLSKLAI